MTYTERNADHDRQIIASIDRCLATLPVQCLPPSIFKRRDAAERRLNLYQKSGLVKEKTAGGTAALAPVEG